MYTAGGYQALKKWLSYRETEVIGRPLRGEEILHFAQIARRITEVLAMGPALNEVHELARDDALVWPTDSDSDQSQVILDEEDFDQENVAAEPDDTAHEVEA
jgi:hypothetical protein